ncbi:myosin-8-like [Pseudoliparis swirei]|uniref:myosin-8-like n=1 Tax=Pseudoliparis swirei TaxID=2059687 RepID=UPI0024BE7095|nr:myosin-8-like [Pseudoliparis swirei]
MPRAHGREQDLMKENRSIKRLINKLECEKNNPKMAPNPDLQSVTKELHEVKTQLKEEQEQNALTVKHLAKFKKQCDQEKLLRQQMERDFKSFDKTKIQNDKEVEELKDRVQKLLGCKHVAEQEIVRQRKELEDWEEQYTALNKELLLESKKHENLKKKNEVQVADIETYKQQEEKYRANIKEINKAYKELKAKCKRYSSSNKDLKVEEDKRIEREICLLRESEHQTKEAEKQRLIIVRMEEKVNTLSNSNVTLQDRYSLLSKQWSIQEDAVLRLRNEVSESQSKNTTMHIEAEGLKTEKELLQKKLHEAQEELKQKTSTTTTLQKEVEILKVEADANSQVLDKTNHECKSLGKKLKRRSSQLTEARKKCEALNKTDDLLLGNIKLNEVIAEKEKLEKELLNCKSMVEKKENKLNLQDAEMVSFQKSNQDSLNEVSFLLQENRRLQDEMYITKSRHRRVTSFLSSAKNFKVKHLKFIHKNEGSLLAKKNKEITELRRMLARRPDDAIQKFQESQWDNRGLRKQLQAAEGMAIAFEKEYRRVREENQELTDTVRKLRLENKCKRTHLPPISKTHKPPTEERSKDQCRLGSIKTGLPNIDYPKSVIIKSLKPFPPPRS